ncbi:tRNA 2'-phosphotransferase [Nakaseomyces bracarensis]|uniref:tRNA 2'-phosphotransferase n=1 Tax=Nakaseomyces bracarensis TaxID=273131 RepID=UPI0038727ED0
MSSKRDIQISKALSYLLRHGAVKENLTMDNDGYVEVSNLLSHQRLKSHKCTLEDLHRVVDENDKKRYHIKTGGPDGTTEYVCAVQGHSIKTIKPSEELLERVEEVDQLPANLIHGTSLKNAIQIVESGSIKKLNRNHVHLSIGDTERDDGVISGMRKSSSVHIYLLNNSEMLDKIQLYKSLNAVYLTPDDVDVSLFKVVKVKKQKSMDKNQEELIHLLDSKGINYEFI